MNAINVIDGRSKCRRQRQKALVTAQRADRQRPHWPWCLYGVPDAERGFTLIFSGAPFPGHQYRLDWQREEGGGNWYYSPDLDMQGWLCPALFKYFSDTPKTLYAQIKARS
jgi:hypothetical protein